MQTNSYDFIMDIISSRDLKLSKSEESIMRNLKLHNYDITKFDITEFAHTFFVSNSTVTRFSQKLGFLGYQQFRYAIESNKIDPIYKTQNIYMDMINSFEQIDENLLNFIKNLDEFNKIGVIGIGSSGLAANEFIYKLSEIGSFNADYAKEPYSINLLSASLKEDDLLIALSLTGENTNILEGVDNARAKGAKVFSITKKQNSTLEKLSDHILHTPSYSTHLYAISKMAPIILTIDIICEIYQSSKL